MAGRCVVVGSEPAEMMTTSLSSLFRSPEEAIAGALFMLRNIEIDFMIYACKDAKYKYSIRMDDKMSIILISHS